MPSVPNIDIPMSNYARLSAAAANANYDNVDTTYVGESTSGTGWRKRK